MLRISSALMTTCISCSAFGHVHLLTPTGDDALEVGTTYEISWQITIVHKTQNWDLEYTTVGLKGPWSTIVDDLPVGDNSQDSIHTYDWIIPDTPSDTVWVRVIMDNVNGFYDDTNDQPFSIVAPATCPSDINGDALVNVSDLLAVIDQWGQTDSEADISGDGVVDVTDLLMIVGNWGPCT